MVVNLKAYLEIAEYLKLIFKRLLLKLATKWTLLLAIQELQVFVWNECDLLKVEEFSGDKCSINFAQTKLLAYFFIKMTHPYYLGDS